MALPTRAVEAGPDARDRLLGVGPRAEGGEAEIALAAGTEAGAGRAQHLRLLEQAVEEVPRRHATGRAEPDVGRVAAAIHLEAGGAEAVGDDARVPHVAVDQRADLLLALRRVDGGRRLL